MKKSLHYTGPSLGYFYVAPKKRMAYLSIPKAGCTSLINMMHHVELSEFTSIGTEVHRRSLLPRVYAPRVPADFFRFTFVRNPYHRLLSFYNSKVKRMADPDPHVNQTLLRMGLYEGMPFPNMVDVLSDVAVESMDLHCAPQYLFIEHHGQLLVNFVGRLENLAADWQCIERECRVTAPLLSENLKFGADLQGVYEDSAVADKVYDLYRRDFELLGYDRSATAKAPGATVLATGVGVQER